MGSPRTDQFLFAVSALRCPVATGPGGRDRAGQKATAIPAWAVPEKVICGVVPGSGAAGPSAEVAAATGTGGPGCTVALPSRHAMPGVADQSNRPGASPGVQQAAGPATAGPDAQARVSAATRTRQPGRVVQAAGADSSCSADLMMTSIRGTSSPEARTTPRSSASPVSEGRKIGRPAPTVGELLGRAARTGLGRGAAAPAGARPPIPACTGGRQSRRTQSCDIGARGIGLSGNCP